MRCVVQRVKKAAVTVAGQTVGKINKGLLVLVGIGQEDGENDIRWLGDKITGLRIFEDEEGKFNLSLADVQGQILLVSQFTLFGDCRRGKRPSFSEAAPPLQAKESFDKLVEYLRVNGFMVETGEFQANMDVELINQGPVTIMLDSKKKF
ncbi:MAG: D-tyrosyl-tRNA(Tyr) deacylase [Gracilibacter sp. BRH_c7a]|nr:MAG: D-tyrosyl-tRNA(Tyr) deacylase [Gracilibacter sp. BRH_c7a]